MGTEGPSQQELEAAHCWEPEDRVPGRPEMTALRRRLRLHQARWREARGYPIGSQPIVPREGGRVRPVGSRLPLDFARESGANFATPAALDAATARAATKEPRQTFDKQRLWADLLWPTSLSCNLFGDLAADLALADRVVHTWWPDAPGAVNAVRFAHSPGRLDLAYLGSLVTFDVAFMLDLGDGTLGVIGVTVKYHEYIKREVPKPIRLAHYVDITDRSRAFVPGALDAVNGTPFTMTWLTHLLVHSMLQHESRAWRWGRYVVVHAAANSDYADGCTRYGALLADPSSFAPTTIEDLLDSGALPASTVAAVRERYLPG